MRFIALYMRVEKTEKHKEDIEGLRMRQNMLHASMLLDSVAAGAPFVGVSFEVWLVLPYWINRKNRWVLKMT